MSKNSGASVIAVPVIADSFGIHPKVILEGDRGESLVFGLDIDAFLRFHRLVKPIGPAPPFHHPAGELVDDHDLLVLDDIVDVLLEHDVGFQSLVQVMDDLRVGDVVEVAAFDQPPSSSIRSAFSVPSSVRTTLFFFSSSS